MGKSQGCNRQTQAVFIILIILLSLSFIGCGNGSQNDMNTAINLVENLGNQLKNVSLMAPDVVVKENLQKNYGEYVSPDLLAMWVSDPQDAPGRLSSSPWPERIDVLAVERSGNNGYEVKGVIVEITSTEVENEEDAIRRPITLIVEKINDNWLINSVSVNGYETDDALVYKNVQYGFSFSLPKSWKGYEIVADEWQGIVPGDAEDEDVIETGPIKLIRHPQWSSENPRQDIPVMIFTDSQWNALQNREFSVGAAPIGPKELACNDRYVFALPARYNFAFLEGYEEVEVILNGSPLKADS